jgi:hypothetical protein
VISSLNHEHGSPVELVSEQLPLLSGESIAKRQAMSPGRVEAEGVGVGPVIAEESSNVSRVLDLVGPQAEQSRSLSDHRAPGHRLSERAGPFLASTPAGASGGDRPPLHPALHSRDHALAAPAPSPRAQDQEPARGKLSPRHRQPNALGPARRAQDAPMSCQGALRSREAGRLGERRIA